MSTTDPQRLGRLVGVFFILTFVLSIPALVIYGPILDKHDYILGAGGETRVLVGAFLEIGLVIANIATAVLLFPVARRFSETLSLGYVASRILESVVIAVGIISLLSVVTLRQDLAGTGADAQTLSITGRSLLAVHDWTFLLGPAFCAGFGNGILLGNLMYRSGLVPRRMALFGVIGGPIAFASATAVLFGAYDQTSAVSFLFTLPEIVWEASFGIYLATRGFRAEGLANLSAGPAVDRVVAPAPA